MQIHIDYICLAFCQCVFSSESAIEILEGMHNHIGYIGNTFRHYEFSNVSSNALPERKQSHIGRICAVVLRSDVFAYSCPAPPPRVSCDPAYVTFLLIPALPPLPWSVVTPPM